MKEAPIMAVNRRVWIRRWVWTFILIGVIAGAGPARAANNCPWLSETTASSLLGGEAMGSYSAATERKPAVCMFTQQTPQGDRLLEVTVQVAMEPQAKLAQTEQTCGTDPAPLHAIGNEAIFCTGEDLPSRRSERAVGRVRDQVFAITFTTSIKDDSVLTREALKARIYTASEQVAGNLF
jgi:hypothetical protein